MNRIRSADTNREAEILVLDPVCTHNIWGGTRLREDFGYPVEGDDIGECWGISAHPSGDDVVKEGKYRGVPLSRLWEEHSEFFGNTGNRYDRFPLLVKIIDAKDNLSIQVHPDDAYAKAHEHGSYGKTECWYVLDCPEDATLVIGHHAKDKKELTEMIEGGRWTDFIREIPVHKGDFIQIDPGTVHAIKGGLLILETQQNSDITYRVFDYNRLSDGKPRELHVKQSIDVIKTPAAPVSECVKETGKTEKNKLQKLYGCRYYQVFKLVVDGECSFLQEYPFLNMTVTEGDGILDGKKVKKGDHFILLNGYGEARMKGKMEVIASTVG